jgi:hypothetical protein
MRDLSFNPAVKVPGIRYLSVVAESMGCANKSALWCCVWGLFILLTGTFASAIAASPPPLARQALFVDLGNKVMVYRVPPGSVRSEPQNEYVGTRYETQVIYINNYPVFQSIPIPEYRYLGDKLILTIGDQERTYTRARWRLVDVIDREGYKAYNARIDIDNAANDFGLRQYELKLKLFDILLAPPIESETSKLELVMDISK